MQNPGKSYAFLILFTFLLKLVCTSLPQSRGGGEADSFFHSSLHILEARTIYFLVLQPLPFTTTPPPQRALNANDVKEK